MHPWFSALLGGVLIGLAATWLLWATGRIAGVSGIVDGLVRRTTTREWMWRASFVAGLMVAGGIALHMTGQRALSPASWPVLIVAGLLVGIGTTLGGGCTSGHGVCGLGRLSKRSLVATLVFVGVAMATVFLVRHAVGPMP
jgi:uncharacterized protein